MALVRRVTKERWFIAGARKISGPTCTTNPICLPTCFEEPPQPAESGSGTGASGVVSDCAANWSFNPNCGKGEDSPDCPECEAGEVPDTPPDWYLQGWLDHYPACPLGVSPLPSTLDAGGNFIPPTPCDIVAVADFVLTFGAASLEISPGVANRNAPGGDIWFYILSWWRQLGAVLSAAKCINGNIDGLPLMPQGDVSQVSITRMELPAGSYLIRRWCVDIPVGEEVCEC